MLLKTARATLVVLTVAGSALPVTMAVSGTAQAAPAPCFAGTWRLTAAKAVGNAPLLGTRLTTQGGVGTIVKIGPRGATVFDFARSARVTGKGRVGFRPFEAWVKYEKVLRMGFTVTGSRSGKFTARPRTAAGPATAHGMILRPERKVIRKQPIAPSVRRGEEAVIPKSASYTCTPTRLHLHQQAPVRSVPTVIDWWFKRVPR